MKLSIFTWKKDIIFTFFMRTLWGLKAQNNKVSKNINSKYQETNMLFKYIGMVPKWLNTL